MSVIHAFEISWALRRPFLLSHLMFNILMTAFLAPMMAIVLRVALALSGQPALSDMDIAAFFLTPVGFLAMLAVAGIAIMLLVLDTAFLMAIAVRNHATGQQSFADGLIAVIPRLPALVEFGFRLTVRALLLALPFVGAALALYWMFLTEFDINYYLSERPPKFLFIVGVSVLLGGACFLILAHRLIGWAVALPLVVFSAVPAKASFGQSTEIMQGNKLPLTKKLIGWGILSTLLASLVVAITGTAADAALEFFGNDLRVLARVLLVFAALALVLNLLTTTLTTGALAVILAEKAGWPTPQSRVPSDRDIARIKKLIAAGLVICAIVFSLSLGDMLRTTPPDRVEVIAHRGAAGSKPENTMAAVLQAIEDGADWIEIDVQETADGEVIVMHDSDFMKIGAEPLKVWDATLEDVARIDIGSWFDPVYADQRTPLLSEVLEASRDRAGVLIELKYYGHDEMLEKRVAEIVAALGMEDQVMAMSLKYAAVQKMKSIRPDWKVGLLSSASAGRIWQLDADFLAVNKATLSSLLVREMRAAGKKLYVWTVNEPMEISRVLSQGVDGVITDEPALAREVIDQRRDLNTGERLVLALANFVGVTLDEKEYRDDSP